MKNIELKYSVENQGLCLDIAPLLTAKDHAAWWKGENGADGYASSRVLEIQDALLRFSNRSFLDIQIWEQGNAFISNLNVKRFKEISSVLSSRFNAELYTV